MNKNLMILFLWIASCLASNPLFGQGSTLSAISLFGQGSTLSAISVQAMPASIALLSRQEQAQPAKIDPTRHSLAETTDNDTTALKGTWTLTKCEIMKDSAGVVSAVEYNPKKETEYYRWFIFRTLTFGENNTCSVKINDYVHDGTYSLTTNTVVMDFASFIPIYGLKRESKTKLQLNIIHQDLMNEEIFFYITMYYSKK